MRSHARCSLDLNLDLPPLSCGSRRRRSSLASTSSRSSAGLGFWWRSRSLDARSRRVLKLNGTNVGHLECHSRRSFIQYRAADEGSGDTMSLDNWDDIEESVGYAASSSDSDDSDGDTVLTPLTDVDLPAIHVSTNDALTIAASRLAALGTSQKKRRIKYGVFINLGLITFLVSLISYVDWCAWRIVRLPLEPFYLSRPFFVSALLVTCAGYICIPLLDTLKIHQLLRKEGPTRHSLKKRTPTMGGLFFIPIGVIVAKLIAGFSSIEVAGAAAVTIAFSVIGLADDMLSLVKNKNHGLSAWLKIIFEVAVGACFTFWLDSKSISSPYGMKMLIPLPALGLVCLGKCYHLLTTFCFVSMGNGVNLTDGLDGLAGGTSALAFVGMSIAVLPICPDLAIFGSSMAGACVGFLLHNRYRASLFMGDTGSLALGGALASMAACTGMFIPLFIASGVFVWETVSVILQVSYFKTTRRLGGAGRRLFKMAPFHHHLELCGIKEPIIVAGAYLVTCALSLFAGYVGLISA